MVDSLELRDSIFMYRAKKGMMVVVADAESAPGYQTKTYMFLPSEDPADYVDAGKIWNTYDEYQVHSISEFIIKYGLDPWVEVSLGLKDPDGPGIDSLYVSSAFIDTIYSNVGDTIYLVDKAKTDSLYTNALNVSGVQILGISTDETFASASNDSIATQLAVKSYVDNQFIAFGRTASIENLTVDTLTVDTAFISNLNNQTISSELINVDTLLARYSSIDTLASNMLVLSGDTIQGISDDVNLGSALASNDSISTQLAVKTYVDTKFTDFGKTASIENLTVDTLTVDTAFISNLLSQVVVSDSINVDTLIALYSTMDTASINKVNANYFTLNGYWVGSISNDTVFTSADSLALITEFGVQNRIDSVMIYVNDQFSNLSQNSIQNPINASTKITVNENDSLVFTVNGDTALVVNPDGSVVVDTLLSNMLVLSGDTIQGISKDINLGGVTASDDSIATQLAVKTYVDTEVAKLSGSTSTDTLRANVAFIENAIIDTLVADTAYISELLVDSLVATRIKADTIIIPGDTIIDIAKTGDVIAVEDEDNTLVTAGYVNSSASAFPDGANPITRTGWTGVSGQDLDAANVVDFLKKVFFPVPEPRIASVGIGATLSTETLTLPSEPNGNLTESVATYTVPYATWKSGLSMDIDYDVRNRSAEDVQITTTNIETIKIEQGTYTPAAVVVGNGTTPVTGTFPTVNLVDLNPAPVATTTRNYTFTTSVTDAYPNVNALNWVVSLSAALRTTNPSFTVNPSTVEDNGGASPYDITFAWAFNPRDEVISDVTIDGTTTGATASGSVASNGGALSALQMNTSVDPSGRTYTLSVDGDLYTDRTRTAAVAVCDRSYRGILNAAQTGTVDAGSFTINNTNLSQQDKLCETWESATGFFTFNTPGGQDYFICFAVPKSDFSGPPVIVLDTPLGAQDESGTVVKEIIHTFGTKSIPYYVVYSTTAYGGVGTVDARLRQP